jgi:hypothetical protein
MVVASVHRPLRHPISINGIAIFTAAGRRVHRANVMSRNWQTLFAQIVRSGNQSAISSASKTNRDEDRRKSTPVFADARHRGDTSAR